MIGPTGFLLISLPLFFSLARRLLSNHGGPWITIEAMFVGRARHGLGVSSMLGAVIEDFGRCMGYMVILE